MKLKDMLDLMKDNSLVFVYYGDNVLQAARDTYLRFYSEEVLNLDVVVIWVSEGYLRIKVTGV